jgi:putative inorganic carbon (HCO3(-)) transporter
MSNHTSIAFILDRVITICLYFLFAVVPLIINPTAYDYWYKPKIDSVYALIIIIVIAVVIKKKLAGEKIWLKGNPLLIPLMAYGIASILSTIFTISPKISIQGDVFREEGIYTLISYSVLPVIFYTIVESEKQLLDLVKGLLVSTTLISTYAIIQYLGYDPTEHFIALFRGYENRPGSTIGNPNFLGKFLVLTLPLFIVHYCIAARRIEKFLLLSGGFIACCALILTYTRASWLSFAFSVLVLAVLLRKKIAWSTQRELIAIAGLLFIVVVSWEAYYWMIKPAPRGKATPSITTRISKTFDLQRGGISGRLYLWGKALVLIKEKPLLGYGLDTHEIAMDRFNLEYSRKFKVFGVIDRAHNNYLDIAIAQGLVGLGSYLAVIITFILWLKKTIPSEKTVARQIWYCGVLSAVAGYLINDFFIFSVVSVSPTFWSLMGITITMKKTTNSGMYSKGFVCS